MGDRVNKKWQYKEGESRSGWYDDYLLPGEHRGQVSGRAAKARHRVSTTAYNNGTSEESVRHAYKLHQYDDRPGEPTSSSTKSQQKNLKTKQENTVKKYREQNSRQPGSMGMSNMEKYIAKKKLEDAFKKSTRKR